MVYFAYLAHGLATLHDAAFGSLHVVPLNMAVHVHVKAAPLIEQDAPFWQGFGLHGVPKALNWR